MGGFSLGRLNSLSFELRKSEDRKKVAHHGFRTLIGTDPVGVHPVSHRAVGKIVESSIQSVSAQEPFKSKSSQFQVIVIVAYLGRCNVRFYQVPGIYGLLSKKSFLSTFRVPTFIADQLKIYSIPLLFGEKIQRFQSNVQVFFVLGYLVSSQQGLGDFSISVSEYVLEPVPVRAPIFFVQADQVVSQLNQESSELTCSLELLQEVVNADNGIGHGSRRLKLEYPGCGLVHHVLSQSTYLLFGAPSHDGSKAPKHSAKCVVASVVVLESSIIGHEIVEMACFRLGM